MATGVQVTFDCADPQTLSRFWADALGYHVPRPPHGFHTWDEWAEHAGIPLMFRNDFGTAEDPTGHGPRLFFQRVCTSPPANRVHIDINAGRGLDRPERLARVDAEVSRLVSAGATRVRTFDQYSEYWVVMQDPEGNCFCVQ